MNKNRLEAFSDGVLAIIITIMILELKIPRETDWSIFHELGPQLLGYVLSFVFVGIYWGNHHHLLQLALRVNAGIMWANLNLLFWLSLIPFATGWMGTTHFATYPVATYGILLEICGLSFMILHWQITRGQQYDHTLQLAIRHMRWKGTFSTVFYAAAIAFAFHNTRISCGIFVFVAMSWLVPERLIELALNSD